MFFTLRLLSVIGAFTLNFRQFMFLLLYVELFIHICSTLTAFIVILKITLYDSMTTQAKWEKIYVLQCVTRFCICLIYSSVFFSDSAYFYVIFLKIQMHRLVLLYEDIVVYGTLILVYIFSSEPTPMHRAIFCHEIGTWIYVWGVILTALERLFTDQFKFSFRLTSSLCISVPMIVLIIFSTSYFCTNLLISHEKINQQTAAVLITASQVFGVSVNLFLRRRILKYRG